MKPALTITQLIAPRPVGIVALTLGSDLAHSGGAAGHGSYEFQDDNADPDRLNDNSYQGGGTHNFAPYVSFEPENPRSESWFGIYLASSVNFGRIEFQTGDVYGDGGWFTTTTPDVEVWNGSSWVAASNVVRNEIDTPNVGGAASVVNAGYPGTSAANGYHTYRFDFDSINGSRIRVIGATAAGGGNTAGFIACEEVWCYAYS